MNTSNLSGKVRIIVKPNAKKTEILGEIDGILKVSVAAPAEGNKANLEIVKFFSKLTGKRVRIVSGLTSKKKTLSM